MSLTQTILLVKASKKKCEGGKRDKMSQPRALWVTQPQRTVHVAEHLDQFTRKYTNIEMHKCTNTNTVSNTTREHSEHT